MESLYLLIPLSIVLVFLIGVIFWWSVRSGQFDDLEGPGYRVVSDDEARAELANEPYKLELIGIKGNSGDTEGASVEVGGGELTIYDNVRRDGSVESSRILRSSGTPNFEFAVRSVEPEAMAGGLLWGRAALFDDPASVRLESDVPGGHWIYAVRNLEVEDGRAAWLFRLLAILLAALAGAVVHTVLGQRRALSHQAGIDALTELPNRRLFDDRLEQSLRRQARDNQRAVAVVFVDLNGFKAYNDNHGHRFGDTVLRVVGRRLRDEVRLSDTVSRWAGDEYALIVEDAQPEEVTHLVNRLRSIVAAPFRVDGTPVTVTAAFGMAFFPQEAVSAAGLLELADQRMYADKQALAAASGKPG